MMPEKQIRFWYAERASSLSESKNISPINGNPSAVGFGKCSENVQKSRFTWRRWLRQC